MPEREMGAELDEVGKGSWSSLHRLNLLPVGYPNNTEFFLAGEAGVMAVTCQKKSEAQRG